MKDLQDVIEEYAQKVVDDMDIDALMEHVSQSIIERLEAEEETVVITEIKDSVYSDEILEDYEPTK